ncbi:DNA-binding protein [Ferrovibrio sp.]|uniref:DNA-binding protein n=1 Tax=Ferrovibrio sp. TaxID=1917215 RepID=UPI0035B0D1C9
MKAWFSASELEKLQLPGLPGTQRNITETAKRENWTRRQRQARGGGWEYSIESLPEIARLELLRREAKTAAPLPVVKHQAPIIAAELRSYQRTPMEARQYIIEQINAEVLRLGVSRLKAEEEFCRLAKAGELAAHLQKAVLEANARPGEGRVISAASLRRWRKEYERGGAAALAVKAAKASDETPAWLEPFWKLYAIPSKPSVAGAYYRLQKLQPALELPHLRVVQRFVADLDAITGNRGRFGPREMKRFRAYKTRDFSMLEPSWIYSADGHKADMEVQDPKTGKPIRPEIVCVIDIATRRIVGWSAGQHEAGYLVGDALLRSCQTAVPAIFYVDNGSGFCNDYMENPDHGLLGGLGITMLNSLPYNSQARGVIEKFHQTWVREAKFLPAFMGEDMDAEAKNIVFKRSRRDIARIGTSRYIMPWSEFLTWAQQTIDDYNNRPHGAFPKIRDPQTYDLRHPSPNEVWNSFIERGWHPDLPDQHVLDDARRPYEWCTVQRGTVRVLGGRYFHERLDAEGWHGRRVMVGYDLHSSEKVWVRAEDGRLICIAQLNGNSIDYMPKAVIEQARERRASVRLRNAERKVEELRIETGDAPRQLPGVVIDTLTPEQEARVDAQLAAQDALQLPAPDAIPAAEPDGRPTFLTDEAWVLWVLAGNGDDGDRELLKRRMQKRSFCELYDLPWPGDDQAEQEADVRAAG